MIRLITFLFPLLVITTPTFSQTEITWKTLSNVRYTDKYYEEEGDYFLFPHFGPNVKALEGKNVYLKGYILAIDPEEDYYLLSSNPYASCFFCGNGGPETIVELILKKGQRKFKMDQLVTIMGVLRLNDDNIYQCNYIFEEAELFEPN